MDHALWQGIIFFLLFIPSIAFHEYGHAQAAYWLGDDTAKREGRLTLNPIVHIDPIGTIAVPLFSIFFISGFALFGWAKPVPFDKRNLRYPRRDDLLITLAGPGANFLLAFVAMLSLHFIDPMGQLYGFVRGFVMLNVFLGVFNLITIIPPLDGYRVVAAIFNLPESVIYRGGFVWPILLLLLINLPPYRELLGFIVGMVTYILSLITFVPV
ncbi:MAG: site-2 protease family protein [Verrucomicrobiota bacterium]